MISKKKDVLSSSTDENDMSFMTSNMESENVKFFKKRIFVKVYAT